MLSIIIYIITFIAFRYAYKKHKLGCKVAVMEMNFNKFNTLAVILLFTVLELACIIALIFDIMFDTKHNIEITLFALNTIVLCYYVIMNKSNICFYLRQLKKITGKKK